MFFSRQTTLAAAKPIEVLVVSPNAEFRAQVRGAFGRGSKFTLKLVEDGIEAAEPRLQAGTAGLILIDLNADRREDLLALQKFMGRNGARPPVVVITESFNEAVARWFLQIRVADFLKKPIESLELVRTCLRVANDQDGPRSGEAEVFTFLPASGGVGVTTLAIETANLLMTGHPTGMPQRTCLIDLDFQNGSCADHLDIEPGLDLAEILPNPERLDAQLLDMMLVRHKSGLSLLAAPNRPGELARCDAAVVTRLLDLASSRFDQVVIDLPRAWAPWTDDVLAGSNNLFIITEMTVPGIRLARRLYGAVKDRLGDEIMPRAIVNRYENRLFGAGLRRSDLDEAFGSALAGVVNNNYRLVREAIDRGVTLTEVKGANSVRNDLKKILRDQAAFLKQPKGVA